MSIATHETPRHCHVMVPHVTPSGHRPLFGQTWCGVCGLSLFFLLETEKVVQIVRKEMPPFFSHWGVQAEVLR